ncbi:MAG: hypothetical protein P4L86_23075 [Mycobacterium sp.]|nr:hypothetical protein [Mycobacterium sp.]
MATLNQALATAAVALTIPAAAGLTAAAPAAASATHQVSLFARMHSCDFQPVEYAGFHSMPARIAAEITSDGHTAVAHVDMTIGTANAQYVVRLIPAPHSTLGCLAGDPSITTGSLSTDMGGSGSTTLQAPIGPGTTGMWIAVDLPVPHTQAPREFYSSDFIASV